MMEYNNYYPVQPGQPPPPTNMMTGQADCSPMGGGGGQMMNAGPPPMMQPSPAPSTPLSMRHTPGPPPIQAQQHMGPGPQMHPHQQPSPHPGYHQLPQHPPISHSASPHPSTGPHSQQPPPRPATGPSPLHHQSPIHINGPSPKLQSVPPLGPPSQPQTPGVGGLPLPMHAQPMSGPGNMNHHASPSQNFMGSPMPVHSSPHYGHSPMNNIQPGAPPPHPSPASMHHPGPPMPQPGPPPQHPANMGGRGPMPPGQMPMNQPPPPPGHMMPGGGYPPPPPPPMIHQHHQGPHQPPIERGSPYYRHSSQAEFRIMELTRRLDSRPRPLGPPRTLPIDDQDESIWWKRFACDFFDDHATVTFRIPNEDKGLEYTIGRTLIPRFFKSYFDGGVTDLSIKLRNLRESSPQPGFIVLDCDQTDICTKNYVRHPIHPPLNVLVNTEGHLIIEFVNVFDNLLIKSWRFYANQCHEYVDRPMTLANLPLGYLTEPVTRFGLTKATFSFLKMCLIMEPMQDLMFHHRQTNMDPRACLKHILYVRYKHKDSNDITTQPNKRRRRKANTNGGPATTGAGRKSKANSNGANAIVNNPMGMGNNMMQASDETGVANLPLASQNVLVVGEPSMLGADFGDENERRITRLENNQFDPSSNIENPQDNLNHITQTNHLDHHQQQQPSQQPPQQQQQPQPTQPQQQIQQQQVNMVSDEPIDNNISSQVQNEMQNHDSYQDPPALDTNDVSQTMNYTAGSDVPQADASSTNDQYNSDEKLGLTDANMVPEENNKEISLDSNNGSTNNNNNQVNSFLMNGSDKQIIKSDVDLKQPQQTQSQQPAQQHSQPQQTSQQSSLDQSPSHQASQQQQQQQQQPQQQQQQQQQQSQQQQQRQQPMTTAIPAPLTEAEAS